MEEDIWTTYDKFTDLSEKLIYDFIAPQSSQVTCNGIEGGCGSVHSTLTNDVLTPYYQTLMDRVPPGNREPKRREWNYTSYDLFSLRTKLSLPISQIDSTWYPHFNVVKYMERGYVSVDMYSGDRFVPLDASLHSSVQKVVDDAINTMPGYCLLIHDVYHVSYEDVCMPAAWIGGVLPLIPHRFRSLRESTPPNTIEETRRWPLDVAYFNGSLYVRLEEESAYATTFRNVYEDVLQMLSSLYKRGSVVLFNDSDFIELWKLVPYNLTDGEKGVYTCDWFNPLIARDRTHFLTQRLQGTTSIKVNVRKSNVSRHVVSEALTSRGFKHYFSGSYVHVEVSSYEEAEEAATISTDESFNASGLVRTSTLYNPESLHYVDARVGVVSSSLASPSSPMLRLRL